MYAGDGRGVSQASGNCIRARRGSRPACFWKSQYGRNELDSNKGDLHICSEIGNSRGRVHANINDTIWYLFYLFTSPGITISAFIHVATNGIISFI